MKRENIKRGDIVVNKPIPWPAFDKDGLLLLEEGCVVESESQLEALLERGLYRFIGEPRKVERIEDESPFDLLDRVQVRLERLFNNVSIEKEVYSKFRNLCQILQKVCSQDADAALGSILVEREGRYTVKHPIHTALVCEIVSSHLEWPNEQRLSLLGAALTMNIGMIILQEKLYRQEVPLSDKQRQAVRLHPERGSELLRKVGVKDPVWLNNILQHHEAVDGSGYPRGLKGDEILQSARMISLADIYCAKASGRGYRAGLPATQAIKEFFKERGQGADTELEMLFIKKLGLYPPGSFVRLKNNEIAVVTHRGEAINQPIVHSVVKSNGLRLGKPLRRDCRTEKFAVKEIIAPGDVNVTINRFKLWGYYQHKWG